MSSLAEMATIFLVPKDRDAVLGDLAETGASGWSALGSLLGALVRPQMEVCAELVLFPARMVACGSCRTIKTLQRKGGGMKTRKKQFVTVVCALLLSAV